MMKRLTEQQENFISILTHDLKTPILAQKNSLELLISGMFGELTPEQMEIIKLTKDSCETILDMVMTILANYKFENNQIYLEYEQVNLQEVVEEVCAKLTDEIKNKQLDVKIYPFRTPVKIRADRKLLKQAVYNVVANSISYAYKNSVFCIRIDETELNSCISIINKGEQLSDSMIDNMFDYYACNSSKHTKIGFGIKLYLALQIVKAHLGGIVVRNSKGDEVVFDIILPISGSSSPVIPIGRKLVVSRDLSA